MVSAPLFQTEMDVMTAPFGSASNYATGDARVYVFISYALKGSAAGWFLN
jgi:hypothetical protein